MATVEAQLKALMIQAQGGDGAAYASLLSALSGYLRGYFRRRLGGDSPELEDLVQETLLAIHLKRTSYDPGQPFTPWVYAMARYKLLDHFRRTGARPTIPLEHAGELLAAENFEEGAVRRDVSTLLSRLTPPQRALVADVKLGGIALEEAAQTRGLSVNAVKVRLHRALRALSHTVADEDR